MTPPVAAAILGCMKITQAFLLVDDQDAAKHFYTEVLGLEVETDYQGEGFGWLSLKAPGPDAEFEAIRSRGARVIMEPTRPQYGGTDALIEGTVGTIICLHQD